MAVKHTVRTRDGGKKTFDNLTRNKAIAMHCTECMGWGDNPKTCTSPNCALFPFRKKTESTIRVNQRKVDNP